ncbi:MAG: deoxyguanosinetriphosphate triphosphohydrolase, partial [Solirubrobacteraceae bacterium]
VHDMVEHSEQAGEIVQGPLAGPAMARLREFMFERVYLGPAVRAEHEKIAMVLGRLFEHYVAHPELLPASATGASDEADGLAERVTDYLAGMTDRYCIREYTDRWDIGRQVPQAFAR